MRREKNKISVDDFKSERYSREEIKKILKKLEKIRNPEEPHVKQVYEVILYKKVLVCAYPDENVVSLAEEQLAKEIELGISDTVDFDIKTVRESFEETANKFMEKTK